MRIETITCDCCGELIKSIPKRSITYSIDMLRKAQGKDTIKFSISVEAFLADADLCSSCLKDAFRIVLEKI